MDARTDLMDAIKAGDAARVQELLASDRMLARTRDERGLSAVLLARYYNRGEILQTLLATGVPLDIFDAAATGSAARVAELVTQRPELTRAHSPVDGATPLHLAAFFGQPEIAEQLVSRGADIHAVAAGFGEVTPLHSAAAARNARTVATLLRAGADPNARQRGGYTPLHSAANNGDIETARLLLSHRADRDLKTDEGKTAIEIAQEKGHAEIVALLSRANAAAD